MTLALKQDVSQGLVLELNLTVGGLTRYSVLDTASSRNFIEKSALSREQLGSVEFGREASFATLNGNDIKTQEYIILPTIWEGKEYELRYEVVDGLPYVISCLIGVSHYD